MTFKSEIIKELEINPKVSLEEIKKRFPTIADKTFYNYRTQWRKSKKGKVKGKGKNKGKGPASINPPKKSIDSTGSPPSQPIIDDPDELLMSVAIRMLNKPDPDPRWANILISCKKENINIKGDDIESFRKLPNQVLAHLLNKSKQKT